MFASINMFWARLRLIFKNESEKGRRAQNILMPKNINSVTIIITLEGIEKIKTEKKNDKWQQDSLNNHASIYNLNGFYFSINENAQELARKYEIFSFDSQKL